METAWEEFGPYFMHETNSYGTWAEAAGVAIPYRVTKNLEELRRTGLYRIVTPDEFVEELIAMGEVPFAVVHPMVGGIPPARAWHMLELFEQHVIPKVG